MPRCTPLPRPWISRTSRRPVSCAALMYSSTTDGISPGAKVWRSMCASIGTRCGMADADHDTLRHRDTEISSGGMLGASVPRCVVEATTVGFLARGRVRRRDDGLDAAADREITDDRHSSRGARSHEIVEDLVGDGLVKDPSIAKPDHVVLQRLQLDTAVAGHVADADFAEVRKACLRADGGELRAVDRDLEVALRTRIRECLQRSRA